MGRAHALIDLAKNGSWDEVFESLDSQRELINVRPEVREYSVLHQAAYHGSEETVNTLIDKYGADAVLRTKSGELITDIAKNQGAPEIIRSLDLAFLRGSSPKRSF